jgi:hypothetical protein
MKSDTVIYKNENNIAKLSYSSSRAELALNAKLFPSRNFSKAENMVSLN